MQCIICKNEIEEQYTEDGIMLENEVGHLLEEAGVGMPADLDLGIDENASFTVS